jgi:hypothetical protein
MARLSLTSGCKVAWATYDNEDEATEAAKNAATDRERKLSLGYDFGYLWPGSIQHVENHPEHGCDVWVVTLP